MGRIQKKKDPNKKKKLRLAKTADEVAMPGGSGDASSGRLAAVLRKSASVDKAGAVSGKPNFLQKSVQFYREVKIELKKVTWPTRKQTMGSTVVVVILVVIISLFLGLVDLGLSSLVRAVLR